MRTAPSPTVADAAADEYSPRRWWTLSVLCLSLVLVIVGNTTLNVALPTLVRTLGATASELQWMVDAYALVFAGLLLTAGALGDRFGRKGALTAGLVVFGVATAVAARSTTAEHIIIARAVMGIGAALIMPATLSILTNAFPPHERGRAIAVWAGLSGAGAAIGPIASGWLLEHYWFGSIFLVNVPVVLLALGLGRVLVPTSKDPSSAPLDPVGALLSIVGLTALVYGIIEAPARGWASAQTVAALAVAALVLGAFAWWELRTPQPMLDLRLFRNPQFATASAAITLVFFAMFGSFFLITQYLQLVLGYTALEAGVRTLPMAATMVLVAPRSARLAERIGARWTISGGLAVLALGLVFASQLGTDVAYWRLAVTLVVMASGMALSMAPATGAIMASLPLGKAGVGSAVNDTTRELGGALGVAVLGSLLASAFRSAMAPAVAGLPEQAAAAIESLGAALAVAGALGPEGAALALAARVGYVDAMGTALLVGAAVVALASALVAAFLPSRVGRLEPVGELELVPAA